MSTAESEKSDIECQELEISSGVLNADMSCTILPTPSHDGAKNRRRQTITLCVATLAIVGVTIGVAVGMNQKHKTNPTNASSLQGTQAETQSKEVFLDMAVPDISNEADSEEVLLGENVSDISDISDISDEVVFDAFSTWEILAEVCNPLELMTEAGYKACEDACLETNENYGCCSIPPNHDGSCLNSLTDILACGPYLPCASLQIADVVTSGSLALAPPTLADACASGYNGDIEDCELMCEAASCCTQDPTSDHSCMTLGNMAACASYLPCGAVAINIADTFTKGYLKSAPENLSTTCKAENILTEEGRSDCEEACQPSECCTIDPIDPDSCMAWGNMVSCASYFPCSSLNIVDSVSGGTIPMADLSLLDTCMDGEQKDECDKLCEIASCCNIDAEDSYLHLENVLACASYWPCSASDFAGAISEGFDSFGILDTVLEGSDPLTMWNGFLGGFNAFPVLDSLLVGDVTIAPDNLYTLCRSEDANDRSECLKQCEAATCCRGQAELNLDVLGLNNCGVDCASFIENCPNENLIAIADSIIDDSAGDIIDVIGDNTEIIGGIVSIPPAPSNLSDVCNAPIWNIFSLFFPTSPNEDCMEACKQAECCYDLINECPGEENCIDYILHCPLF